MSYREPPPAPAPRRATVHSPERGGALASGAFLLVVALAALVAGAWLAAARSVVCTRDAPSAPARCTLEADYLLLRTRREFAPGEVRGVYLHRGTGRSGPVCRAVLDTHGGEYLTLGEGDLGCRGEIEPLRRFFAQPDLLRATFNTGGERTWSGLIVFGALGLVALGAALVALRLESAELRADTNSLVAYERVVWRAWRAREKLRVPLDEVVAFTVGHDGRGRRGGVSVDVALTEGRRVTLWALGPRIEGAPACTRLDAALRRVRDAS